MIGFDTETGLIQGGCLAPPLACSTFYDGHSSSIFHWRDPECHARVQDAFENQEITTANGAYDMAVSGSQYPDLIPSIFDALDNSRVHDVLLRQKLMDIGEGQYRLKEVEEGVWISVRYGLSDLHNKYYGSYLEKDEWRLKYGKLRELPLEQWPEGSKQYAMLDAEVTYKIHLTQDAQKLSRAPTPVYLANECAQVRASMALHLISCWGMRTDPLWVEKILQQIQHEQIVRRKDLQSTGLVKEDESRTKKAAIDRMREIMGDRCELTDKGLELYRDWWQQMNKLRKLDGEAGAKLKMGEKRKLFDKGYVKLSGDICLRSGDEVLQKYAAYGQFQTLYTKISKLRTNRLPIQTSFETILETGRSSSFANKLIPNSIAMQNLPRKEGMRECFVPRCWNAPEIEDRYVFGASDYVMAELVSLAQICFTRFGESKLRDALNAGQDPHLLFGSEIQKLDYAEAVARYNAGDPLLKEARQKAKPVTFGFPGGLGIEKFIEYARSGYGANFTEEEATEYKKVWLDLYPEMKEYFKWISSLMDNKGFCDIKQFKSGRVRGHVPYTVACNTLFQGLTADGAKAGLYASTRRCYMPVWIDEKMNAVKLVRGQRPPSWARISSMYGSRLVNFVHDENVGETKELNGHTFVTEMAHVMRQEYQPFTPDVEIRTEEVLMRRWRKGAKPVTHNGKSVKEGGILVPFEDAEQYKMKRTA